MRKHVVLTLAVIVAASAAPAFAAGSMMKSGEAMMIMPTGEVMTMQGRGGPVDPALRQAATPVDSCMIFMMGRDNKMYMVHDMKMANGKMACEAMSAMGK